jgi:hypothetical protein
VSKKARDSYSIDTCALIAAWKDYPFTNFEPFWDQLERLIKEGRLYAAQAVKAELGDREDVAKWAKNQDGFYVPPDRAQVAAIQQIHRTHPPSWFSRPDARTLRTPGSWLSLKREAPSWSLASDGNRTAGRRTSPTLAGR